MPIHNGGHKCLPVVICFARIVYKLAKKVIPTIAFSAMKAVLLLTLQPVSAQHADDPAKTRKTLLRVQKIRLRSPRSAVPLRRGHLCECSQPHRCPSHLLRA
eukprot:gnl/MRDRNA2_/MRDRNA2_31104_c0_seq1.p2 gnl/MRDRNA2_/MRDRNA2_31104_c0~~gnl/MRDRNA2_/MRDRNA2_31104_c0_seq1.p2  ORF type:complete len:102 (-),score=8.47 gnl/MRDRNA2_/MRDRNA2_31104_c0_seq1:380-685(-)